MGIDLIIGALASGVAKAMASGGWNAVRDRVVGRLAGNVAERQRIAADLDACCDIAANRGEAAARAQLNGLFSDYAKSRPNAEATFQNALTVLNGSADVRTDNSVRVDGSSDVVIAGAGGQAARGDINTNSHNTTDSHNTNTNSHNTNTRIRNDNSKKGGAGPVIGLLVLALLGLAFVVFVIGNTKADNDAKSSDGGVEASADPLEGVEIKTCGQWLRLPQSEGDTVARDIALRLGNRGAAQDPFLVQNTQYNCGGVENRKLADVLAPRNAQ